MAMSEQDGKQASTLQPPTTNDSKALTTYWKEQGQPWRTEPEIDLERQVFLTERRSIPPDIKQGIYPFKDIKLSRADVEWLLATHENGKGAVDWKDESQRKREGLDLRGANVRQEDLSGLPLAHMRGGLTYEEWKPLQDEQTEDQINMAAVQLQGANLREAQMQGAILRGAQLQGAILVGAQMQEAYLFKAQLQRADLF
jgi:Pentapeptide repeats (8 copies)